MLDPARIIQADTDGKNILCNAPRYFSELIKNRSYSFQSSSYWKVIIRDDILYPLDSEGTVIKEGGRPLKDILRLAEIIDQHIWSYSGFNSQDLNWTYIIYQSENQLRQEKTDKAAESPDTSFYGIDATPNTPPDKELHIIKNPALTNLNELPDIHSSLWMNIWMEHDTCCLFADSNLGKSILAVQIGCYIALSHKVLYCDYEMSDPVFFSRYHHLDSSPFSFPKNFFRSTPLPEIFLSRRPEKAIIKDLEKVIKEEEFKVIIIDNISFLGKHCYRPDVISELIYRLKILQKNYGISILIVAHANKRNKREPISQYDLMGGNRLYNFIDSCFAIGNALSPAGHQYLKQIKSRSNDIEYGEKNVMLMERSDNDGWLHFIFKDCCSERDCLNSPDSLSPIQLEEEVLKLSKQGLSQRKIAARLKISLSKVNRLLNKLAPV